MFAMAHPAYIREKAIQLRVERKLSIDEIAERLALPKTTIYYWVKDIPLGRSRRENPHPGTRGMQRKYLALREEAYEEGRASYVALSAEPTFCEFVALYIAEGYKRSRNAVALANSDPIVIALANRWTRRFARNPVDYRVQHHADQDLNHLRDYWSEVVSVEPAAIRFQRKSNSGQLAGRIWRCEHGVMTVRTSDTYFRARLQAWIDCTQQRWLDWATSGA